MASQRANYRDPDFLFLCKPLATLHHGTLLEGMLLLTTELSTRTLRPPPPKDKPMDKGTQPSHIPCPELVSQTPPIYPEEHYVQVTGKAFQLDRMEQDRDQGYAHIECS
ncbi:hypothetical protein FJTKL_04905 [Diaporthe vaccinii]|uniref:Uncharacterized protein n=1 Tax=Diaporthe vaccinii TaxID=105482 RepID=A0ABR4DRX2_9PEZI